MGAAGFAIEAGLSDATEEEAQIKRLMVEGASEVVGLVDHTKWGRAAFATFCQTADIDVVVTDVGAPPAMVAELRRAGVEVRLVEPSEPRPGRPAAQRPHGRPRAMVMPAAPAPAAVPPTARPATRRRPARHLEAVRGDPGARPT